MKESYGVCVNMRALVYLSTLSKIFGNVDVCHVCESAKCKGRNSGKDLTRLRCVTVCVAG